MDKLRVGDEARDFTLASTGDKTVTLSALRGRPVVLVFYPGDATPVCTKQLRSYSDDLEQFSALDAVMLALSPQDIASHETFREQENLGFDLLYDEDKRVGQEYGVLGPLGFYRRSVFVLDPNGVIVYARRGLAGLTFVSSTELADAVRSSS